MELPENLKNEEGIEMAIEALRYANSDEYLREIVEARDKVEHDIATRIGVGKREGIKEGEKKEKLKTAKKLFNLNVSIEIISKSTGLSIDEINKLK